MPRQYLKHRGDISQYAHTICHTIGNLLPLNRHRGVVLARQELIYKLREAGFTWYDISALICRDHKTCIHAYKRHQMRLQNEATKQVENSSVREASA
jgi:hypothetical protein